MNLVNQPYFYYVSIQLISNSKYILNENIMQPDYVFSKHNKVYVISILCEFLPEYVIL